MKRIMLLLATGFEEGEAVETIDVLRRANFTCDSVSTSGEVVTGAHGIRITADRVLGDGIEAFLDYDMIVLPGGWDGVMNLCADARVLELLRTYQARGKWVAAICAAPVALAKAGVVSGRTVTSYPSDDCRSPLIAAGADYVQDTVAVDGNLITSRGPATALPFAYRLVDALGGDSGALKQHMLY
jgi:4-methyl-5(b-hydroxyethyl)-thiazole monophosphate biosynthesis